MQKRTAHQLHVKSTQAQRALCALADIGKGLGQQVVQAFAVQCTLAQFGGLLDQTLIRQLFELWLQRVDLFDQRAGRLDLAVVRCSEHLFGERSESQHVHSSGSFLVLVATGLPTLRATHR